MTRPFTLHSPPSTSAVYLSHLSLTNFRNFSRLELDLSEGITLVQGENAQGKTSFLEAVAYLSTSRSLLATAERELVHWLAWEEPLPFARLVGELVAGGRKQKIEITVLQASKTINGAPLLLWHLECWPAATATPRR